MIKKKCQVYVWWPKFLQLQIQFVVSGGVGRWGTRHWRAWDVAKRGSWSTLSGVSIGVCWAGAAMLALEKVAAGLLEGAPPGLLCGETPAGMQRSLKYQDKVLPNCSSTLLCCCNSYLLWCYLWEKILPSVRHKELWPRWGFNWISIAIQLVLHIRADTLGCLLSTVPPI